MSVKQDLTHTRTAAALEQKYSFGKKFSEIIGLIDESRDKVDSVESTLRSEISEQATTLTRSTEEIVMSALENYETIGEAEKKRQELKSEMTVEAERIAMDFDYYLEEQIRDVDGDLQTVITDLQKHFEFSANGLTIKAGENQLKLRIDNDMIAFYNGNIDEDDLTKNRLAWWDGNNFHVGNIYVDVDEVAQFGPYGFVPIADDENDGLDFVRVGG